MPQVPVLIAHHGALRDANADERLDVLATALRAEQFAWSPVAVRSQASNVLADHVFAVVPARGLGSLPVSVHAATFRPSLQKRTI